MDLVTLFLNPPTTPIRLSPQPLSLYFLSIVIENHNSNRELVMTTVGRHDNDISSINMLEPNNGSPEHHSNGNGSNGLGEQEGKVDLMANGGQLTDDNVNERYNEQPKFDIEPVQLQFALNNLCNLKVQNNIMFIILEKTVFKIDLDNPSIVKLFEFNTNILITNCWLSPNGQHFIVQINHSTYYYLHNSYDKFKILPKFKSLNIKAIVFPNDEDLVTNDFLIITNDDSILVGSIKSHVEDNKKDDRYIKQVYNSSKSIVNICFTNNNCQINLFTADETLQWDCFDNSYNELVKVFKTNPKVIAHKKVVNFVTNKDEFVLITNDKFSNIDTINFKPASDITSNQSSGGIITAHHICFLNTAQDELIVYSKLSKDEIRIPLNEKVLGIINDTNSGTYWIYSKQNIYELVITNESVKVWYDYYKLGKFEESLKCLETDHDTSYLKKDMIYIKQGYDYLQKGAFGINQQDKNMIHLQIKGIKILAQLSEPFEKICLMLINLNLGSLSERLLIEYLLVKFYYSKNIEKNLIRVTVLSSWIIELMLRNIHSLESKVNLDKSIDKSSQDDENLLKEFNDQFYSFLNLNYKNFDANTIYKIMKDLNYSAKLIYFADLLKDYEFILNYHIESEDWENSIKTLIKMYGEKKYENVIYEKATVLLINYPEKTIDIWLKFDLNYEKLLPSLLIYNKQSISIFENYSIIFLQKLIFSKNIKNKTINSHYLSLLITYPVSNLSNGLEIENDPNKFINKQIIRFLNFAKFEKNLYDPEFILRLCIDYKKVEPAIIILINDLKLFEPALKLSIENKLDSSSMFILSKFNDFLKNDDFRGNRLQHHNFNQGKKLWLLFSKYLINEVINGKKFDFDVDGTREIDPIKKLTDEIVHDGDSVLENQTLSETNNQGMNEVLRYLLDSSYCQPIGANLLSLKDLLPLFPESIMVNNFKDEIITSLNQYNNKINQLSIEMKESLDISNNLKNQILESNESLAKGKIFTIIEPGEPCKLCNNLLVSKNFITFPNCHHSFHKDCLIKYYLMSKGDYRFKKIFQLFKKDLNNAHKKELDDIMLSECVLCNESNIISIDNNLIDPMKDKSLVEEWDL